MQPVLVSIPFSATLPFSRSSPVAIAAPSPIRSGVRPVPGSRFSVKPSIRTGHSVRTTRARAPDHTDDRPGRRRAPRSGTAGAQRGFRAAPLLQLSWDSARGGRGEDGGTWRGACAPGPSPARPAECGDRRHLRRKHMKPAGCRGRRPLTLPVTSPAAAVSTHQLRAERAARGANETAMQMVRGSVGGTGL